MNTFSVIWLNALTEIHSGREIHVGGEAVRASALHGGSPCSWSYAQVCPQPTEGCLGSRSFPVI